MSKREILILPDTHIPSHDQAYLEAWLDFLDGNKPDEVILMGDVLDADSLKRFVRNPDSKTTIGDETELTRNVLLSIREKAPFSSIHYLEGNHEERLSKYTQKNAPHLWDIRRTMPELLGLEALNITWHSSIEPYIVGGVSHLHGSKLSQVGGLAAYREAERQGLASVRGHSHRQGWIPAAALAGFRFGFEVGHISDPAKLDYLTGYPNWHPGWAVETVHDNGVTAIEPVQILLDKRGRHGLYFRGEHLGTIRRQKKSDLDVPIPSTPVRGTGGGARETSLLPGTPHPETSEGGYISMKGMTRWYGRSRRTIQQWVKQGRLPKPAYQYGKAFWRESDSLQPKGHYKDGTSGSNK